MTDDEKILRSEHAQALTENPLLKKTVSAIKQWLYEQWEEADDEEARNEIWRLQKAVTMFEGMLLGYIQTGDIARKQLQSKTFKQRRRNGGQLNRTE